MYGMIRSPVVMFALFMLSWAASPAFAQTDTHSLLDQHWFEARTAHFNIYSCGAIQEVSKLSARLEQFHDAYSLLAGAQSVASPPIVVMAFPDHESMEPFIPLFQGKPISLSGFFKRAPEENLIVLALTGSNSFSLAVIFHEYTHLLLRQNDHVWPLWLAEGMAEIYSTFEAVGHDVYLGKPIEHHLRLLSQQPLQPLAEIFAVNHNSPQYNEREHQGIFYAESWLLTHYLMLGDNPARKARFGQLTKLLRQGQTAEEAFTNAFATTLPAMEEELRGYLERGRFDPLRYQVKMDLSAPRAITTRPIFPAEISYRLGNQLLRIGRLDAAETWFTQAQKLAPESPLSFEGLGLLAAERGQSETAVRDLQQAMEKGSDTFLAHYICARERFRLTGDAQHRYAPLTPARAARDPRRTAKNPSSLCPGFGPAHQLLGFTLNWCRARTSPLPSNSCKKPSNLKPESQSYLLSLAQVQMAKKDPAAARHTLEPLRFPNVELRVSRPGPGLPGGWFGQFRTPCRAGRISNAGLANSSRDSPVFPVGPAPLRGYNESPGCRD